MEKTYFTKKSCQLSQKKLDKFYLHQHAKCEREGSTSFHNMKGGHIAIITTQGGENNVMQRIKYLNHITIIAI